MVPLAPPPNAIEKYELYLNTKFASLPPITDPKFNYPPGEWKRFTKKHQKNIRAEFLKAKKSVTAIVPSSPNKPTAAILDRMQWCSAPTIRIQRLSSYNPVDSLTKKRSYWMVKTRFGEKKSFLYTPSHQVATPTILHHGYATASPHKTTKKSILLTLELHATRNSTLFRSYLR